MPQFDVAVVGGGLLGSAFAYGLTGRGLRVVLLDEGDNAIRTARGNFGLVWVQSKGLGMRHYARWSRLAAQRWQELNTQLFDLTGVDTAYARPGGFHIALTENEFAEHLAHMEQLRKEAGEEGYDFEVLDHQALATQLPDIGPQVAGATYCAHDGHCNPLRLLRALHQGFLLQNGTYRPRSHIDRIEVLPGSGFALYSQESGQHYAAQKLVIAAGHGAKSLAAQIDIEVPIHPDQGQVLVTERCARRLNYPTNYVRQTDEGTYLLGPSSRDVGYDLSTELPTLRTITTNCTQAFPHLRGLRVQRSWAALRVMTPDGCPIYDQSTTAPGAFSFACHSGVTLASLHALQVPEWIINGEIPSPYQCFSASRFDV